MQECAVLHADHPLFPSLPGVNVVTLPPMRSDVRRQCAAYVWRCLTLAKNSITCVLNLRFFGRPLRRGAPLAGYDQATSKRPKSPPSGLGQPQQFDRLPYERVPDRVVNEHVCRVLVLVNGTVPQSTDVGGAPINLPFGSGSVSGNLHAANVEIGSTSIDNQMLLQVTPENSTTHVMGILGVGPPIASSIFRAQNGSDAARPPLQRLFATDAAGPSFMTTAVYDSLSRCR
jgi:hypothetical protein